MGNYLVTKKALEDLASIWNYTFNNWSEQQADDYYNLLIASCEIIAQKPEIIGKRYHDILEGLLGFKVKKHILFYKILPNGKVEIIRILHEKMDLPTRLSDD